MDFLPDIYHISLLDKIQTYETFFVRIQTVLNEEISMRQHGNKPQHLYSMQMERVRYRWTCRENKDLLCCILAKVCTSV